MTDDLVKRLRAIDEDIILRRFDPEMSFDGMTAHEAADRIEKLEAALREIASASKVVARNENIAEALAVLLASHRKIARKALEDKQ